jgi:aerobic carbon-monoxide dehydrogenase small subunit
MASKIDISEEIQLQTASHAEIPISVNVNGKVQETAVASDLLLINFLRDTLGLTGVKQGCETGQCGVCIVLVDGVSVKSCAMLAAQSDGCQITTIEGLAPAGSLTPLQNALWEAHAVQCGFCTPALVLSLTDMLRQNPHPDEAEIRRWMDGTLCRCGVYQNAVRAVQSLNGSAPSPQT